MVQTVNHPLELTFLDPLVEQLKRKIQGLFKDLQCVFQGSKLLAWNTNFNRSPTVKVFQMTKRSTYQHCNNKQQTDWCKQLIPDSQPKMSAFRNTSSAKILFSTTATYNSRTFQVQKNLTSLCLTVFQNNSPVLHYCYSQEMSSWCLISIILAFKYPHQNLQQSNTTLLYCHKFATVLSTTTVQSTCCKIYQLRIHIYVFRIIIT